MPLEPGVPLVHHRHATERPPATCVERSQFGRNVSIPAEAMRTKGTPDLAFRVVFRVVFGRDGAIRREGVLCFTPVAADWMESDVEEDHVRARSEVIEKSLLSGE